MFCTNCGSAVPDNATFCTTCGCAITANSAPVANPTNSAPYQPQTQTRVQPQAYASDLYAPPKKSHTPIIVASIIATAVIVLALVFVFTFRNEDAPVTFPTFTSGGKSAQPTTTTFPALELHISQVDNNAFPTVTLYASITENGSTPTTAIGPELFTLTEIASDGAEYVSTLDEIAPIAVADAMNIDLVLDQSGSMGSSGKMANAKKAASTFVDVITSTANNVAEITSFDDYVYNAQPFTSDATLLKSAVNSLSPNGETALFDALFWALQRTNLRTGSRVVIAFTDGEENASHYAESDVIELSRMTGIPVYIVGIGDDVNRSDLQTLAAQCNGSYFNVNTIDLESALADIYNAIYYDQRGMYRIVYTSNYMGDESRYRTIRIACSEDSGYSGESEATYMPVDNVSSFETYVNAQDYVLPDSGSRYYSRAELEKLSLWELYLARNEIFARYGRGFKNQDLVEYFATKRWYHQTATPEQFDAQPSPLNDYEMKNTETMLAIEKERNSPYITQNRT